MVKRNVRVAINWIGERRIVEQHQPVAVGVMLVPVMPAHFFPAPVQIIVVSLAVLARFVRGGSLLLTRISVTATP